MILFSISTLINLISVYLNNNLIFICYIGNYAVKIILKLNFFLLIMKVLR